MAKRLRTFYIEIFKGPSPVYARLLSGLVTDEANTQAPEWLKEVMIWSEPTVYELVVKAN